MLNSFHPDHTFIACGYTDLRRGIDGLATIVQEQFKLDPFTNSLLLFCGRRCDRTKGLFWDGDGFEKQLYGGLFDAYHHSQSIGFYETPNTRSKTASIVFIPIGFAT